jgi:hypothetical protein
MAVFLLNLGAISRYTFQSFCFVILSLSKYKAKRISTAIGAKKNTMSKDKKGVYTGIIEKDKDGNYFCGEYLLDYKYTEASFKLGDEINIKTVIANPSDKSYNQYPKKSRNFFLANQKE